MGLQVSDTVRVTFFTAMNVSMRLLVAAVATEQVYFIEFNSFAGSLPVELRQLFLGGVVVLVITPLLVAPVLVLFVVLVQVLYIPRVLKYLFALSLSL